MKKALMVLGLALCASVAFAQTNVPAQKSVAKMDRVSAAPVVKADYKASVFTKSVDTLLYFHFGAGDTANIDFGWDATLPTHTSQSQWSVWNWISGIDDTNAADLFPTVVSGGWWQYRVAVYMADTALGIFNPNHTPVASEHGFMMIAPLETSDNAGETFNAYFTLPSVPRPTEAGLISVSFVQSFQKFYDNCYIDYKNANGNWVAREVNVAGVDMQINDAAHGRVEYTMPVALAAVDDIEIRFRMYYPARSLYAYYWAVDDVVIKAYSGDDLARWTPRDEYYTASNYGIVPKGMEIPVTWHTTIANTGAVAQTGINASLYHLDADKANPTLLTTRAQSDIAIGEDGIIIIDDRSFYDPAVDAALWYGNGFPSDSNIYMSENGIVTTNLPTATVGKQFVTATVTNSANKTLPFDTILYNVSDTVAWTVGGITYKGFRWGFDNGLLPGNRAYTFGYTADGQYVTDSGQYNQTGYSVLNRLTTGDTVPEGWVFLGVEIVPASTITPDAAGAQISPVFGYDVYDMSDTSLGWYYLTTGADVHQVQASELNDLTLGYSMLGDYNSIFIPFPQQTNLVPNTCFLIGYELASSANFAAAANSWSYPSSSTSNTAYYNDSVLYDYYDQTLPGGPDVRVHDLGSWTLGSCYDEHYPMIRAIVGPAVEVPSFEVTADCGENGEIFWQYMQGSFTLICEDTAEVFINTNPVFAIEAADYYDVDSIFIDGVYVTEYNDETGEGDRELSSYADNWFSHESATDSTEHVRYGYYYRFNNVTANHTIRVVTKDYEDPQVGIQNADDVNMTLTPNPATSQVRLSINGVSGMVNCNIIDMSGRVVYSTAINAENTNTINLSNVPAGAYFVRITNDSFSKVEKLIVR